MRVHLGLRAELEADVVLQPMRDRMGVHQRHVAVDLQVDADRQFCSEVVHGDVVNREPRIAGDHHDALADAFVVVRDRYRGECQIGLAESGGHGVLRLLLDGVDAVDRIGSRHLGDHVDKMPGTDHSDPQTLDINDAR